MCTPALRELKRINPRCHVRFYTNFGSLVRGLSYIDEVFPFDRFPPGAIFLKYEDAIPPQAHLARVMGDSLGVNVRDVRPDCVIESRLVEQFRESWQALPRPHVVVQRRASAWTPNKDWPDLYWDDLIDRLLRRSAVIEVGAQVENNSVRNLDQYIDLRGQTSIEQLVAVVAAADIIVAPMSSAVHIAAAAQIPSVIVYGGYEHPSNTAYTGNIPLYTPVPCSPCWLREPCPYDRKCLSAILPKTVEEAILTKWEESRRPS